jgi:hypothetical protein
MKMGRGVKGDKNRERVNGMATIIIYYFKKSTRGERHEKRGQVSMQWNSVSDCHNCSFSTSTLTRH